MLSSKCFFSDLPLLPHTSHLLLPALDLFNLFYPQSSSCSHLCCCSLSQLLSVLRECYRPEQKIILVACHECATDLFTRWPHSQWKQSPGAGEQGGSVPSGAAICAEQGHHREQIQALWDAWDVEPARMSRLGVSAAGWAAVMSFIHICVGLAQCCVLV